MRKVVLYTLMSLDGAVDHPGDYFAPGAEDVPGFDEAMEENERAVIETQDAVLLGRGMYEEWCGFWPTAPYEPFASFINQVPKHVVTSTPLTTEWTGSEVVTGPVEEFVTRLKQQPGGDIGVHGSIQLARSLLAAGLVDELRLVVGPVVGCPGRRLLDAVPTSTRLELLSAAPTPSGTLLLGYRLSS